VEQVLGESVILVVPVGLLLLVVLVVPLEPTGVLPVVAAAAVPKHSMVEMARLVESILHILRLRDRPGRNSFSTLFKRMKSTIYLIGVIFLAKYIALFSSHDYWMNKIQVENAVHERVSLETIKRYRGPVYNRAPVVPSHFLY
jgi:preprotein translocase subunit Sss1